VIPDRALSAAFFIFLFGLLSSHDQLGARNDLLYLLRAVIHCGLWVIAVYERVQALICFSETGRYHVSLFRPR
jgi:hypothetical protein